MKTKIAVLLGATLLLSTGASADIRFWLAYGDQSLVSIAKSSGRDTGAVLGKAIPTDRALMIPSIGSSYKVQLWMEINRITSTRLSGGVPTTSALQAGIGFDRAIGNSDNFLDKKIGVGASFLSNWGAGVAGHTNKGVAFSGTFTFVGQFARQPMEAQASNAASLHGRGIGFTAAPFGSGPAGNFLDIPLGFKARVVDIELKNLALSAGDIYGDAANEAGLAVAKAYMVGSTPYGSFFVGSPIANGLQTLGSKVAVQASSVAASGVKVKGFSVQVVPEPGSMAALALGFMVVARRRRARGRAV